MEERVKKIIAAVLILLTVIASFVYYNNYKTKMRAAALIIKQDDSNSLTAQEIEEPEAAEENSIKVHAAGAVNNPGLYEIPGGSRVGDLIDIAGGSAPDANLDKINLAAFVSDGQQIYVPRVSQTSEAETEPGLAADSGGGLVNINSAGLNELMTLPGIGEGLGGSIIKYRESNGDFKNPEDIKNVSGIGEKKYEAIREMITVK